MVLLAAVSAAGGYATGPAHADGRPPASAPLWREVWTGVDASENAWLTYGGITVSPWSSVHDEGLRFRFAAGYGKYVSRGAFKFDATTDPSDDLIDVRFRRAGAIAYADALAGYLWRLGPLTAKAFAGLSIIDHDTTDTYRAPGFVLPDGRPAEIHIALAGDEIGVKTALELWLNIGSSAWSSLDLAWTSAHQTYSGRVRVGWRAWPTLSIGVEGIVNGDDSYAITEQVRSLDLERMERRGGAFVRYEWYGGEISLAGGVVASESAGLSPYATLNWINQF